MLTVGTTTTNSQHQPPAQAPTKLSEEFNAREIVSTLQDLMMRVTKEEATPATVQAAVACAGQISNLLRIHLEARRLQMEEDKIQRAEQRLTGRP